MLYTQLTKDEIAAVTKILNSHSIRHLVEVNEEFIQAQHDAHKYRFDRYAERRMSNTFYNLTIEKVEFDRIPVDSQKALERYNIYPELTDVVFPAETEKIVEFRREEPRTGWKYRLKTVVIFGALTLAALLWLDNYLHRILPDWP